MRTNDGQGGVPGTGAIVALGLILSLSLVSPGSAQVVEGRVLDGATQEPVASAVVQLLEGEGGEETVTGGLTDEEGRFRLEAPTSWTYRIRVERIGYRAVVSAPFDLVRDEGPLEVELSFPVEAIALAPMVIVSERPARVNLRLHIRGYYERKGTWGREGTGFGHFLDGGDLERVNAFWVSDLLRNLRGVRVSGAGRRGRTVTVRGTHGGGCVPVVFIDGAQAAGGSGIDGIVSVSDVVAVEVYPGSTGPSRFIRGGNLCGAIALWTGVR